jgi:hypothetical protein
MTQGDHAVRVRVPPGSLTPHQGAHDLWSAHAMETFRKKVAHTLDELRSVARVERIQPVATIERGYFTNSGNEGTHRWSIAQSERVSKAKRVKSSETWACSARGLSLHQV